LLLELRLRGLILQNLGDDQSQIPPHIVLKAKERIATALKKNASMDSERYSALTGMLEFFDLREVENMILARKGTMDTLRRHFQQQGITRKEV
jgi:hypothetical protein